MTGIVKGMASETEAVLTAMEKSMREVKEGLELSEKARQELREISTLVSRAVELASQISFATQEQTKASHTVAQAMQTISNVSEQSSIGASETTRAVRDMVVLSEQLNKTISRFRIDRPESAEIGLDSEGKKTRAAERLVSLLADLSQAAAAMKAASSFNESAEPQSVAEQQVDAAKRVGALAEQLTATLARLGLDRPKDS